MAVLRKLTRTASRFPRLTCRVRTFALGTVTCLTLPADSATAQDRLVRRFGQAEGLPVSDVRSLAQDSVGFLWIGTVGGLFRWDGVEMRRWAPSQLESWINHIAVCGDGRLHVVEEGGSLFEITADGAHAVSGPEGEAVSRAVSLSCDTSSRLWYSDQQSVWRREAPDRWIEVEAERFRGRRPGLIPGPPFDGAWVATDSEVWRLDSSSGARRLVSLEWPEALVESAEGDTLLISRWGEAHLLRGGRSSRVLSIPARAIGLIRRGATVWASFDRYLVALRGGLPVEVLGPDDLPAGGGTLLVDREGSLWLGTFSGLFQFPEPETLFWNDRHGLPSGHTRYLAKSGERIWTTTWQGMGYVERGPGGWIARTTPDWTSRGPLHVDERGILWAAAENGLLEIDGDSLLRSHPFFDHVYDIEPAPGAGVWVSATGGLVHALPGRSSVTEVSGTPLQGVEEQHQILRSRDGRVWLGGEEHICRTREATSRIEPAIWICELAPGAVEITGLVELPSGRVWAASSRLGVLARQNGGWKPLAGNADLASRAVLGLRAARDDGVWVIGEGILMRVGESIDTERGWKVLENLAPWHGLPAGGSKDLIEDSDGTLWITTSMGLTRVPSEARHSKQEAPRVVLIEARVDDQPVPLDQISRLRHGHHRLEVRFAALTFRDPSLVRYQVRLAPNEAWTESRGQPVFRWVDLSQGQYRVEVRASLDGRSWSSAPDVFAVEVRAPWFLQVWVLVLLGFALASIAYLAHRVRVAILLRFERQRTRIAMDLHDEIGSALGSIGILSGILAQDGLQTRDRTKLASKVSEIAGELGTALSDIVWSLDPRASSLSELAARLAEHGGRLFAAETPRFEARFPDEWPGLRLDFPVRRSVLLIGLEALHNAARHSGAQHVKLSLVPEDGGWCLSIEDDGLGLPDGAGENDQLGLGFSNMRRRAEEIGGRIVWSRPPGGGTLVSLHFET